VRDTVRRARKYHHCDGEGYPDGCARIEPGSVYVESVCPPNWDDLGNTGWWKLRHCVTCAQQYDGPRAALAALAGNEEDSRG
jgi:hypothetical protein